MRYRIRHRTTYRYETPVFESFNEVRLQPFALPGVCIAHLRTRAALDGQRPEAARV